MIDARSVNSARNRAVSFCFFLSSVWPTPEHLDPGNYFAGPPPRPCSWRTTSIETSSAGIEQKMQLDALSCTHGRLVRELSATCDHYGVWARHLSGGGGRSIHSPALPLIRRYVSTGLFFQMHSSLSVKGSTLRLLMRSSCRMPHGCKR